MGADLEHAFCASRPLKPQDMLAADFSANAYALSKGCEAKEKRPDNMAKLKKQKPNQHPAKRKTKASIVMMPVSLYGQGFAGIGGRPKVHQENHTVLKLHPSSNMARGFPKSPRKPYAVRSGSSRACSTSCVTTPLARSSSSSVLKRLQNAPRENRSRV